MASSKPKSKPKSKRGGRRAGAGRKSAADKAFRENFNAAVRDRIVDWLPELLGNLKALADGTLVKVERRDGTVDAYETPPNLLANQYLIDRVLGRPTLAVEHSGKDGQPIQVQVYLPDNGRDPAPTEEGNE